MQFSLQLPLNSHILIYNFCKAWECLDLIHSHFCESLKFGHV